MTIRLKDLLAEPFEGEPDKDMSCLAGCHFNHVPEVQDSEAWPVFLLAVEVPGVEVRWWVDHSFDHRRVWRIGCVFLDDKPVMVIKNAGREGDDYTARDIIDSGLYAELVARLVVALARMKEEARPTESVVGPEDEVEVDFYGESFDPMRKLPRRFGRWP